MEQSKMNCVSVFCAFLRTEGVVSDGLKVPKSLCWDSYLRRWLLLLYLPGLGVLLVLAWSHSYMVLEGCTEIALARKSCHI